MNLFLRVFALLLGTRAAIASGQAGGMAPSPCAGVPDNSPPSISCGVSIVPFEGTVLLKRPPGSLVPGRRVRFRINDGPFAPALHVDRNGYFSGRIAVSISEQVRCQGGQAVSSRVVLPTAVSVSAPACKTVTISVTVSAEPHRIVLECSAK